MAFKITIEIIEEVKKTVSGAWVVVGTKEVPRDDAFMRSDPDSSSTRIESVMGYAPDRAAFVQVEHEILVQRVETMDLNKVIKAINNL